MKFINARTPRFWIIALMILAACGVATVWGYALWLDAPNPTPKARAPQVKQLKPVYSWCVKAAFGQLLSYSVSACVAVGCWIVAVRKKRWWSWEWTIYFALWSSYAIFSSYVRYWMFGSGVYTYSLRDAPLMSSESISELVMFYICWIALPLICYSLVLSRMVLRAYGARLETSEFRVHLYVTAIVLLINGIYLEPSTWRVPQAGGGMENWLGPLRSYIAFVVGWHLRNHLMLIAVILAIKACRNSAQQVALDKSIENDQPSVHEFPLRPEDGNPYRYS
jgi:hypothetical protein